MRLPPAPDAAAAGAAPAAPAPARLTLLGGPLDPLTMDGALAWVEQVIALGEPRQHGCLNAAKVVRLQDDAGLRDALWSCDLVTADGQAVVWAARALGLAVPERVAGIDLMERLLARAAERGHRVYLLGARQHVLERAVAEIRRRHTGIEIAGARNGYWTPGEEAEVVAGVAAARPDLLFIALDTPKKELFLARHRGTLAVPFAMGVGGSLDVIAGEVRRAPVWAQRSGLEWAFRLGQEPRRLLRRYVVGNARFTALVLRELAGRGRGRGAAPGAPPAHAAAPSPIVLHIGPSPTARGGVASVIAGIAGRPPAGYRVETLSTFAEGSPAAKLAALARAVPRAARRIPSRKVALVHLHASAWWSFRRKLLFWAIARAAGKPVVWQIHCSRFPGYLREMGPLERRLVARALHSARAVICISADTAAAVRGELGVESSRLPHPVERLRVAPPAPGAAPVVLALGDLSERKGTFTLLRAWQGVAARVPGARLVLAGTGAIGEARALAHELGIEAGVELPGWVAGPAKTALLERAAVLAHPSWAEALPMAVLEALAAGRPVVASRVGGIPEVVEHGINGLLVEPADERGLEEALCRLLLDGELRARLGAAAGDAARAFEPEAVLGSLGRIYAAASAAPPAPAR